VPATIVMPSDAPSVKLAATRVYGAEIIQYDRATQDREEIGRRLARDRGLTLVPPYDDPAVIAGQGTTALELVEEVPDLEVLVVPVSGGGLISGCATAARGLAPGIRVFGVEPADANDTQLSLAAGARVTIPPPATIADGLRVPTPGRLTFPIVQRLVAAVVTVSEAEIREALRFLLLRMKLAVEPSGAVGVAAVLAGRVPGGRVGVVVSGGNIDPTLLAELWAGETDAAPADAGA
jgi:threonine dehydratase